MFGFPDLYKYRNFEVVLAKTDSSGCITAKLSKSSIDNEYYVSIWLHINGIVRVGEVLVNTSRAGRRARQGWHHAKTAMNHAIIRTGNP